MPSPFVFAKCCLSQRNPGFYGERILLLPMLPKNPKKRCSLNFSFAGQIKFSIRQNLLVCNCCKAAPLVLSAFFLVFVILSFTKDKIKNPPFLAEDEFIFSCY